MDMITWIVTGFFLAIGLLIAVYTFLFGLDWLDRFMSRITPEQASQRTREWLTQQRRS